MKRTLILILAGFAFSYCDSAIAQPGKTNLAEQLSAASTNATALSPVIQQALINLQANAEQLMPALSSFNNSAQLESFTAITPPAPPRPSASGANLSSRAGENLSARLGVNSSANL